MDGHKNIDLGRGIAAGDAAIVHTYSARYGELLEHGFEILRKMDPWPFGRSGLRRMLNRLRNYKTAYMLFINSMTHP